MSAQETFNWIEKEKAAKRIHAGSAKETINTWVEGFNLIHSSLPRAHGRNLSEEQRFMVGLLAASINSMKCIFELALAGYFAQAMNLSRMLIEIDVAYWYLRIFPEEYSRFSDVDNGSPKVNDMLQKIESHPYQGDALSYFSRTTRKHIRDFHPFSHVGRPTVASIISKEEDRTNIAFGPKIDNELCYGVFHDTLPMVAGILACTNDLLRLIGEMQIEELPAYLERALSARERDPAPADID